MRIAVLGAGLQGSACAYDLLRQENVEDVTLADLNPERTPDFLTAEPTPTHPGGSSRLALVRLDFSDEEAVLEVLRGHDVVLSAAPYRFNAALARFALRAGCHFSDLGGNTGILREQLELDAEARAAGVSLVPDMGLAPGLVNVLAAEGVRRLDVARSVQMYVGGLPQRPRPPLNYQVVYSLEGALDYYTTPSWVLREGRRIEVEALSGVEELEFDELGKLEAFHTAGGASLLPWEFEGQVERLEYKTLRYPGHAEIMRAIRDLGLLSETPVAIDGDEVVPRRVFISCVTPHLTRPEEPDLVVLRVVAEGERGADPARFVWELLDRRDPETGISAMERTTGFSLAIMGLFLGRAVVERPGVNPAYRVVPYGPYVEELRTRGIAVRESGE
ncbi:MAG: saccharopine dehydrogenase C-terminal domain-containing protein [Gemmatimonadota bacterium]